MEIVLIHEVDITEDQHQEIRSLFQICYGHYPALSSFYHQPPHFRYIGIENDKIIAQLSVAYRYVNRDGDLLKTYGISEFCVHPNYRTKGHASELLNHLIQKSRENSVDVIISLTDSIDFYINRGFEVVDSRVIWLMMKKNRSLGLINRSIQESLVVYPLTGEKPAKIWANDFLDLMGTMF